MAFVKRILNFFNFEKYRAARVRVKNKFNLEIIEIMETFILLADPSIGFLGQTYEVYLNWIGVIIKWLIGLTSVGVGIIIFSLLLKIVVMPFDIYQRIAMRKQNNKMKENQARMEKLQKQYANDKDMYNQKLMEMYRESGISMFSSCLPMILSMVIFIVAINAFNAYASYSVVDNYNKMVGAYNDCLKQYCADIGDNCENATSDGTLITVKQDGKYIYYTVPHENGFDKAYIESFNNEIRQYYIDMTAADQGEIKAFADAAMAQNAGNTEYTRADAIKDYFIGQAQEEVAARYEKDLSNDTKFLWIKNIWATDASYKHPILEYSEFEAEAKRKDFKLNGEKEKFSEVNGLTKVYQKDAYELVTGKLDKQKEQANGYYILILLSIGTILLQQFVSMRSQKEQQQFSSVDGQGASQQKMTMIIMTGMFAIFSFMYSSAFSIYMITSNIFSLGSTLVINKFVDKAEEKREMKALEAKYTKRYAGAKVVVKDAPKEKKEKKSDKTDKK